MAGLLAGKLQCSTEEIGVASTGVIGRYLDKAWLSEHFDESMPAFQIQKRHLPPAPAQL